MSISNDSTNGSVFTPAEGDFETNDGAFIPDKILGNAESVGEPLQLLQGISGKVVKMEAELEKIKQLCMVAELKLVNAKVDKMEQQIHQQQQKQREKENEQTEYASSSSDDYQLQSILGRIIELEKQQQKLAQQMLTKSADLGNTNQKKVEEVKKQQNCWDAKFCHKNLKISGENGMAIRHQGKEADWCSIFAKNSISLKNSGNSSGNFYFEIGVENIKYTYGVLVGFAVKCPIQLGENIRIRRNTYAYQNNGTLWINGSRRNGNSEYSRGDVVGCGIDLATRQFFFTKNGHRLNTAVSFGSSSFPSVPLFPFVSLYSNGDEIEANFEPTFFLATL